MKTKLLLLIFTFSSLSIFAQNSLQKKYDRATFTVIPAILNIKDTLARDTLYTWEKLPYSSFLLSDFKQEFIQGDFQTSEKFYYNHTTIPKENNLKISKSDTAAFENLFAKQIIQGQYERSKFKYYDPPKYKKIPSYSNVEDNYAEWLKSRLENSPIPGEMMMLWTNENVLMSRSEDNKDHRDITRGANSTNFNYYKKLLNKNYIVVQSIVNTQKWIVDPKIVKAEAKAKEVAQKKKSFITKFNDFLKKQKEDSEKAKLKKKDKAEGNFVNPYKVDSNNYDPKRLVKQNSTFLKSYVYKIVLSPELMSDLSSYPPIQPKTAKLEFVCSINGSTTSSGKSSRIKALEAKNTDENQSFLSSIKNKVKTIGTTDHSLPKRYLEGKNALEKQIQLGEYLCATKIIEQLKNYKNAEENLLDSLKQICDKELKLSPEINQINFKNASKIQQNKPENFFYQKSCENFENVDNVAGVQASQASFDKLVGILEKNLTDFKVLTSAENVVKNKIEANIDTKQGIYAGQQYKIIERSVNKDGERYDNRIGTARIIKVSKNLYANDTLLNRTKFAQVDGKKIGKNALMVQDDIKGISAYVAYGYRYKDRATVIGVEFSNKKITKYPGLKFGLNYVSNSNYAPDGAYYPTFFNITAAKESYFSRIMDIRPFVEVGYGGDFKSENNPKRSVLFTAGVGLPFNLYNRKTSQKLKLMPELSLSTQRFSPQACLIAKFEF